MSNFPHIKGSKNMQALLSLDPNYEDQGSVKNTNKKIPKSLSSKHMTEVIGNQQNLYQFQQREKTPNYNVGLFQNQNQQQPQLKRPKSRQSVQQQQQQQQKQQQLQQFGNNSFQQNQDINLNEFQEDNNENFNVNPNLNRPTSQTDPQIQYNSNNNKRPSSNYKNHNDNVSSQPYLPGSYQQVQNYDKLRQFQEISDVETKERVQQQDRVVSFLIEQMNQIEKQMQGEVKKTRIQLDYEKDYRSRLEQNVRQLQDQLSSVVTSTQGKLDYLENKTQRDERAKNELQQKLIVQEQNQKEILFFIRNMQKSETGELLNMREVMQEKITEDVNNQQKEKEKSKALFLEMVRLGENNEKLNKQLNTMQIQLNSQLQAIQNQQQQEERNVSTLAQKGDTGLTYLQDQNEKLEKRIQILEANLIQVGKEQIRDKDQLVRLDTNDVKLSEDVKTLLSNLHKDYNQRLEGKVSEVVNRVVLEHEERVRAQEDLRNNFKTLDQINQEKNQYEKEEVRERYAALDSLMRTELQRKDEALKSLQTIFENQVQQIHNSLKQEESSRQAQELVFRNEIIKLNENVSKEQELFKGQQSNITEKITEMMKTEIQTRLSSDVDLKNLTSAIATDIVQDINHLKDNIQIQNQKFQEDLKENGQECSHRSQQLSRYIDEENKSLAENLTAKYDKMKAIFTKLAEQFKNHLINTDINRKEVEKRLLGQEKQLEDFKNETYKLVAETQKTFENRLKEEKYNLESYTDSKVAVVDDKCLKLEEEFNKDVDILKAAIDDNRQLFTNRINNLMEQNDNYHKKNEENMNIIIETTTQVEQNVVQLEKSFKETTDSLDERLSNVDRKVDNNMHEISKQLNETALSLEDQIKMVKRDLDSNVDQITTKMAEFIEIEKETQIQFNDRIKTTEEQVQVNYELLEETTASIENVYKKLSDQIIQLTSEIHVEALMQSNENSNFKVNIKDLLDLQLSQQEQIQMHNTHYEEQFVNISKDIQNVKQRVLNEISETYDQKIQNIFTNLKKEQQDVWDTNIKNIDSLYKDGQLDLQGENVQAQLNEILLTQDVYNKPQIHK